MAFKREKKVKGHSYHYLVQNSRQDGRVRQRILQYWGRAGESPVHKAYRENLGPVTPIIAEELARAERQWPDWIMGAIREAVVYDKLSLAYILGVLEAWQERGGPDDRKAPSASSPSSVSSAIAAGPAALSSGASRYPSGRPIKYGTFVIGGYTHTYSKRPFRSLVLGLPVSGGLRHVANVGVGFKLRELPELYDILQDIRTDESPFEAGTDMTKVEKHGPGVSWVKPVLIAEVTYSEVTRARKLSMPMFRRLRPDLKPEDASYDGGG